MRHIKSTYSLATYLDELEFTEAALAADPATSSLAGPFVSAIAQWDSIFLAERSARREVMRADAVVAVRTEQLDETRKHVSAQALVEAHSNRNDPSFVRLFPIPPSMIAKRPLRKQYEFARDVLSSEIAKRPDDSPLKALLPAISSQCNDALSALDSRTARQAERQSVMRDVDSYKREVNRLRDTTHAELCKIAANTGKPRTWADAFFRRHSGAEAVDTSTNAPATVAPNGG